MSLGLTTANPSTRNSESPRSRHNTTSTTMATTPAFAFMGQGTSSATAAARVTPAAASGTTAAPSATTMTTVTSAATAGVTTTPSSATITVPNWSNGAVSAVTTTAVPVVGVNAPFPGVIFGSPAVGTSTLTSTTTAVAGGGTAAPMFGGTAATSSTVGGSTAGPTPVVPTMTTTTHTAGRFTPARLTETPTNLWGNASTNSTNFFGNQAAVTRLASTGTPPGPGRFFNNFATRPSLALATTQPATTSTSTFSPSPFITNQVPQLQCTKEIRFRFEWCPETISTLLGIGFTQQFRVQEGDVDTLQCSLLQTPDTFKMTLDFATTNLKGNNQSWLQTVSVFTVDQKRLTSVAVFWPGVRQVHCSWPKANTTLVKNAAGRYGVDVILSSEKSGIQFNATTSTTYTDHCDSILGKMLDDPSSYDVFFEFDSPEFYAESVAEVDTSDSETGSIEKIEAEDEGHQQKVANNVGVKKTTTTVANKTEQLTKETDESSLKSLQDTKTVRQPAGDVDRGRDVDQGRDRGLRWSLDKIDLKDEEAYVDACDTKVMTNVEHVYTALDNMSNALTNPPTTIKSMTSTVETLGAHKIVLSQYEYFKTMFSSSFAEGGPGVKRIKIKHSDIHCFRLLIQFLYLGRLRPWNAPTVLTQDCATLKHQPSWEDVYMIADRYSIVELKDMAGTRIIQGLSSEWAVPFLFRTGYLFEEMRRALIKYVVKNNMDEISHKRTQEAYFTHPECTAIFGEIIAELWTNKSSY